MPEPSTPAEREAPADTITPKVIEYLVKKGYNRTEQMLRLESSKLDREGRPIQERAEDGGTEKYATAYKLLSTWIKQNLDIYKVGIIRPNQYVPTNHLFRTSFDVFCGQYLFTLIWSWW
jgi:transcription initiation factor TFIID subunit 5